MRTYFFLLRLLTAAIGTERRFAATRSTLVAFGVKRTLTKPRCRPGWARLMQINPENCRRLHTSEFSADQESRCQMK